MKYILTLLIILIHNSYVNCQPEVEVYKQVFEDFILGKETSKKSLTVLIREEALYMNRLLCEKDYPRLKDKYKKLSYETFMDFIYKNNKRAQIDSVTIKSITIKNTEIVMLKKMVALDIKDIYSSYPNWNLSFLEFSNIGFDVCGKQAMVYYGFSSGPIGAGLYIIYQKKRIKWRRKKIIAVWSA